MSAVRLKRHVSGVASVEDSAAAVVGPAEVVDKCRMYRNEFPEVNDLVLVHINSIAEFGAYVSLIEYNKKEGLVPLSELSRKRIRSIHNLIRVGSHEVAAVLRVDKEKGCIDLSKRRVTEDEITTCLERYAKSKTVHNLLTQVSKVTQTKLLGLYEQFGWDLYQRYGHALTAFELALKDPDIVFGNYKIAPDVYKEMMKLIKKRLTPVPQRYRADIEVTCIAAGGIDAIREALICGQNVSTATITLKARLIAPPMYMLSCMTIEPQAAVFQLMHLAIAKVQASITQAGGSCVQRHQPRIINEQENLQLKQLMHTLETENEEVPDD